MGGGIFLLVIAAGLRMGAGTTVDPYGHTLSITTPGPGGILDISAGSGGILDPSTVSG